MTQGDSEKWEKHLGTINEWGEELLAYLDRPGAPELRVRIMDTQKLGTLVLSILGDNPEVNVRIGNCSIRLRDHVGKILILNPGPLIEFLRTYVRLSARSILVRASERPLKGTVAITGKGSMVAGAAQLESHVPSAPLLRRADSQIQPPRREGSGGGRYSPEEERRLRER